MKQPSRIQPSSQTLSNDKCQFTVAESLWGSLRKIEAIPLILGPFMWITRIQLSEYLIPPAPQLIKGTNMKNTSQTKLSKKAILGHSLFSILEQGTG